MRKRMIDALTAEEANSLLDFDPDSGILSWKYRLGLSGKASNWNKRYAGHQILGVNGHGYVQLSIHKRKYEAHRIIWLMARGSLPTRKIDHKNGIKTDNRLNNLREATTAQNAWNSKKARGASIHAQTGRWQSRISLNGTSKFLGLFDSELEAMEAYKLACIAHRGEFTPYV